jgi:hypothetical protein
VPSDFYVRDWTATPAFFDDGTQPSTNPIYWTTSDVWNQSTNVANAPGPDGYVLGDAPNRAGSNFAFARVSRRAPAAASAPNASVKVTFYLTPFGFGAPYTSLGSETVTFGPADMMLTTPAHAWSVPAGAPSHLGLAVEIEAPDGDIFSEPSLSRTLKFASDRMRPDNNKAQRNLRETIGTSAGTEIVAFLGNEGQKRRTLKLRVDMPKDVTIDATLATVGGREPVKLHEGRHHRNAHARAWRQHMADAARERSPGIEDASTDPHLREHEPIRQRLFGSLEPTANRRGGATLTD